MELQDQEVRAGTRESRKGWWAGLELECWGRVPSLPGWGLGPGQEPDWIASAHFRCSAASFFTPSLQAGDGSLGSPEAGCAVVSLALQSHRVGTCLLLPQGLGDELCGIAQRGRGKPSILFLYLLLPSRLPRFLVQPLGLCSHCCQLTYVGGTGPAPSSLEKG